MNWAKPIGRYVARVFSLPETTLVFIFIARAALVVPPAHASASGGQVGEFLSYGAGARAMAMGSAFTSVSDDASGTYWNPAGLSQVTRQELTLMQSTLFADTTLDFYSYVHPSKKGGSAWGVSLTKLGSAGFEKVDAPVDPNTGNYSSVKANGTFAVQEQAMSFAYGRKV